MATYPHLPFILIGDSGQHDPEIYRRVVEDYPNRIRAIYIRDVSNDARHDEVQTISAELAGRSVPMLLTPDTWAAAADAAERGLISAISKDDVQEKVEEPEAESEQIEDG